MIKAEIFKDYRVIEISVFNKRQSIFVSHKNRKRALTISEESFQWADDCDEICRLKFQNDESIKNLILELQNLLKI